MVGIVYPILVTTDEKIIYSHKQNLGDIVVKNGTNVILANPVYFETLTIEDNANLYLIGVWYGNKN